MPKKIQVKVKERMPTRADGDKEEGAYRIYINNEEVFKSIWLGEHYSLVPDKDCYNVIMLLKQMYNYGKEGKQIEFGMIGESDNVNEQ